MESMRYREFEEEGITHRVTVYALKNWEERSSPEPIASFDGQMIEIEVEHPWMRSAIKITAGEVEMWSGQP